MKLKSGNLFLMFLVFFRKFYGKKGFDLFFCVCRIGNVFVYWNVCVSPPLHQWLAVYL